MASRRRPPRARRGARRSAPVPAPNNGGSGETTRTLRGTKQTVPCPACGTEYRIPNELLDQQIACKNCGRAFTPSKASKRRISSQSNATPFIVGGAILVFMILGGWVIVASSGTPTPTGPEAPAVAVVETGIRNSRVRDVSDWMKALQNGNSFDLSRRSDFGALRTFLGIENLNGSAEDVEDRVTQALLNDERTHFFRECEVTGAEIEKAEAAANKGHVRLALAVRDEFRRNWSDPVAEIPVGFQISEGTARVTGWDPSRVPAPREPAAAGGDVAVTEGTHATGHETIKEETVRTTDFHGEKVVVREAELVPLGHLDDTPEPLRQEIDGLIAKLMDLNAPGATAFRSTQRLKEIGKPAIPRLLNALYETPLDNQENILRINRVTAALYDMTGQRFGFSAGVIKTDDPAAVQAERLSALKQWYAWWARNASRDKIDFAIDEDEEPLPGEPPKKSRTMK